MAGCQSLKSYGLSGDSSPASPLGRRSIFSTRALPQSISSAIREGIADNVKVYRDEAKLSVLTLSGWPLIDEAETVSQLLLPRLNEIQ